jgi:DNA-binding NarL/FixJ family response regulator
MSAVSMVVADGSPLFLCGLIGILRSERDFDIVARCCNGIDSLQAIRDLSPDIALLDSSMPMASGINILASAISKASRTRIVLLASPTELQSIFAVADGAYGIIPRNVLPEVLIHDLRQVAAGRRLPIRASRSGGAYTTTDTSEKALLGLTKRERQMLSWYPQGCQTKRLRGSSISPQEPSKFTCTTFFRSLR